jgi:hypothetical protein
LVATLLLLKEAFHSKALKVLPSLDASLTAFPFQATGHHEGCYPMGFFLGGRKALIAFDGLTTVTARGRELAFLLEAR